MRGLEKDKRELLCHGKNHCPESKFSVESNSLRRQTIVIDCHYIQQSPTNGNQRKELKSCQGREIELWVRKSFFMLKC